MVNRDFKHNIGDIVKLKTPRYYQRIRIVGRDKNSQGDQVYIVEPFDPDGIYLSNAAIVNDSRVQFEDHAGWQALTHENKITAIEERLQALKGATGARDERQGAFILYQIDYLLSYITLLERRATDAAELKAAVTLAELDERLRKLEAVHDPRRNPDGDVHSVAGGY